MNRRHNKNRSDKHCGRCGRIRCCPPREPPTPEPPPPEACCGFQTGDLFFGGEFLIEDNGDTFRVQHAVNITALRVGTTISPEGNVRSWIFTTGPISSPDCLGASIQSTVTFASLPPNGTAPPYQPRPPFDARIRLVNVLPGPTPDCIIAEGELFLFSTLTGLPIDPAEAFGDESTQDFAVHVFAPTVGLGGFTAPG